MSADIFTRNPDLVTALTQVYGKEIEKGRSPEVAMRAVLGRAMPLHAQELARRLRAAGHPEAAGVITSRARQLDG